MQRTESFEREVAAWFADNAPRNWESTVSELDDAGYVEFQRAWLRKLNERGFGAPGVSKAWGGGGYDVRQQAIIFSASARAGAPPNDVFEVSLNHVPGTFVAAGTPEQQEKYIRPAIAGTVWCQGFSEPGAGSDLAALATRAVPDGAGGWRVSGQKIWSSHAAHAEHCLLLARTDPDAPNYRAITYFVMDMDAPGVTVRPIKQIHGPSEFCEIFLDDVPIPAENVIGAVNDGWSVAQSTLSAERGPMALPIIERIGIALQRLAQRTAQDAPGAPAGELSHSEAVIAGLLARQVAVRSLALDMVDLIETGQDTGSLASLIKVSFSELLQEVTDLGALMTPDQTLLDRGLPHFLGYVSGRWMSDWLGSWAATIAGGANEVQRNIIAERLLGLPREPKPERSGRS